MDLDTLPPVDQPLERLRAYQAARARASGEEDKAKVDELLTKRARGEVLSPSEEAMVPAFNPTR